MPSKLTPSRKIRSWKMCGQACCVPSQTKTTPKAHFLIRHIQNVQVLVDAASENFRKVLTFVTAATVPVHTRRQLQRRLRVMTVSRRRSSWVRISIMQSEREWVKNRRSPLGLPPHLDRAGRKTTPQEA